MTVASPAMSAIARRRAQSLAAIVRDELERMILNGELEAGERINEQVLATRFGVSRGPIREAARALERSGLVTAIVNHGVFVRELDVEEAAELYDMRAMVFGYACGRLAESGGGGETAALRSLVAEMDQAIARNEPSVYYRLNLRFHDRVMEGAGHRRASQIYEALVKEAHLFRKRSLLSTAAMTESNEEHGRIVDAVAAGDVGAARAAAERHHVNGRRRWLDTLKDLEEEDQHDQA